MAIKFTYLLFAEFLVLYLKLNILYYKMLLTNNYCVYLHNC